MKFDGKVVFVTGAARGIGEVLVRSFADEGARAVIADVDYPAAQAVAQSLGPQRAFAVSCDVSDRVQVDAAVADAVQHFGGIDVLVNNAGRHTRTYNRPPTLVSPEEWRVMLGTNVMGVVNCSAAVAPIMQGRGGGAILNMSSVSGFDVRTAYGVSKLAVRGLTVALAVELAPHGIRVNGIAPGLIDTPTIVDDLPPGRREWFVSELQLIKRQGHAEDLIGISHLLCSSAASFITGETVLVGGGFASRI